MTDTRTLLLIDNNSVHADALREAVLHAKDGPFKFVQTLSGFASFFGENYLGGVRKRCAADSEVS